MTLVRQDRTVGRERERASSLKSRRSRQTEVGVNSGTDAEAERIWQETTTEEDDNRSIVTRAASLKRMETGSKTGSILNENREGGELNFVGKKKCVLKVAENVGIEPQEGKWVYVDYGSQMSQTGEYLQPMLLNTIVER